MSNLTTINSDLEVKYHPVYPSESNFVRGINYIPEEGLMEVRLKDEEYGEKPYYYPDTSQYTFEQFTQANSYGKYYSNKIKANTGSYRDYEFTTDPEIREELETALENTIQGVVTRVQSNAPTLYDEHQALFESVNRRKADKSVLKVKENSELLKLAYDFRQLLLNEAMNVIIQEYPNEPSWVTECKEIQEEGATASTSYMALTQI